MVRVRIRVSSGFRDTVRVSFRVSVRVTVTLGLGIGLELRFGPVLDSPPSYIMYGLLCPLGLV